MRRDQDPVGQRRQRHRTENARLGPVAVAAGAGAARGALLRRAPHRARPARGGRRAMATAVQAWDTPLKALLAEGVASGYAMVRIGAAPNDSAGEGTLGGESGAHAAAELCAPAGDQPSRAVEACGDTFRVFYDDRRAVYAAGARGALLLLSRVGAGRCVVVHARRDPSRQSIAALERTCDTLRQSE